MEPKVTIDIKEYNYLLEIKRNSENGMKAYKDEVDKKYQQHRKNLDEDFKRHITDGHFVEYLGVFKDVREYGTSYQVNPIYATRVVNSYESRFAAKTMVQLAIDRDQLLDKNRELTKKLDKLSSSKKWWKIWKKN